MMPGKDKWPGAQQPCKTHGYQNMKVSLDLDPGITQEVAMSLTKAWESAMQWIYDLHLEEPGHSRERLQEHKRSYVEPPDFAVLAMQWNDAIADIVGFVRGLDACLRVARAR